MFAAAGATVGGPQHADPGGLAADRAQLLAAGLL